MTIDSLIEDFKGNILRELDIDLENPVQFEGKFKKTNSDQLDLSELREGIKKNYKVDSIKEVKGIYKIYVEKNGVKELFYIGMSKSSIFSRLKRHYAKPSKSAEGNVPIRYSFFKQLIEKNNKVTIEIIRIENEEKLNYLLLIEELLTLTENPKYKDDITNKIKVNNSSNQNV